MKTEAEEHAYGNGDLPSARSRICHLAGDQKGTPEPGDSSPNEQDSPCSSSLTPFLSSVAHLGPPFLFILSEFCVLSNLG